MIVLWRKPFLTIFYFLIKVLLIIKDCALRLFFFTKNYPKINLNQHFRVITYRIKQGRNFGFFRTGDGVRTILGENFCLLIFTGLIYYLDF